MKDKQEIVSEVVKDKTSSNKGYKVKEINGHKYAVLRLDSDKYYRYVEEYRLSDIKRIAGNEVKPEDLLAMCYGEGAELIRGEYYTCLDTAIGDSNGERGAFQFLPNKTNNPFSKNFERATQVAKQRLLDNGYDKNNEYKRRCAIGAHNTGSGSKMKCKVDYGKNAIDRSNKAVQQQIFNF